jgi:hypothetical protein
MGALFKVAVALEQGHNRIVSLVDDIGGLGLFGQVWGCHHHTPGKHFFEQRLVGDDAKMQVASIFAVIDTARAAAIAPTGTRANLCPTYAFYIFQHAILPVERPHRPIICKYWLYINKQGMAQGSFTRMARKAPSCRSVMESVVSARSPCF